MQKIVVDEPEDEADPKTRIMVIDDDPDITDIIARALRDKGNRIVTMNQMEVVLKSPWVLKDYDVVVVDLFMPGIGGLEGIKRIKEENPSCKVIAISGGWGEMSYSDALSAAKKIGADHVLSKPFRVKDIRNTVKQVLES